MTEWKELRTENERRERFTAAQLTVVLETRMAHRRLAKQHPDGSIEQQLYESAAEVLADKARRLEAKIKRTKICLRKAKG